MKITIPGTLIFLVLVAAFFVWFGGPPDFHQELPDVQAGIERSWGYSAILFITGAGTACFGDKEYGMFPPASLRWLFIAMGILIMIAGVAWMHAITRSWPRMNRHAAYAPR